MTMKHSMILGQSQIEKTYLTNSSSLGKGSRIQPTLQQQARSKLETNTMKSRGPCNGVLLLIAGLFSSTASAIDEGGTPTTSPPEPENVNKITKIQTDIDLDTPTFVDDTGHKIHVEDDADDTPDLFLPPLGYALMPSFRLGRKRGGDGLGGGVAR